jgi:hypothetical protein
MKCRISVLVISLYHIPSNWILVQRLENSLENSFEALVWSFHVQYDYVREIGYDFVHEFSVHVANFEYESSSYWSFSRIKMDIQ